MNMITITNSDIVSAIAIVIFTGHIWMYELDEIFKKLQRKNQYCESKRD